MHMRRGDFENADRGVVFCHVIYGVYAVLYLPLLRNFEDDFRMENCREIVID